MIDYRFAGPLTLMGNLFEPASARKPLAIHWGRFSTTVGGQFVAIGNYIASTLAEPFTGALPTFRAGNMLSPDNGVFRPLP